MDSAPRNNFFNVSDIQRRDSRGGSFGEVTTVLAETTPVFRDPEPDRFGLLISDSRL